MRESNGNRFFRLTPVGQELQKEMKVENTIEAKALDIVSEGAMHINNASSKSAEPGTMKSWFITGAHRCYRIIAELMKLYQMTLTLMGIVLSTKFWYAGLIVIKKYTSGICFF